MLKRTRTKQRSDDRTTNLSRLIIIGNLRIDLFSVATTVRDKNVWWETNRTSTTVNPKCGLRVECVGNRHDNIDPSFYSVKV